MSASPPNPPSSPIPLLGRVALHLKLISLDQLSEATREQGSQGGEKALGAILVQKGFLSRDQLQQVVQARAQIVARQRAKQAVAAAGPATGDEAAAPAAAAGSAPGAGPVATAGPAASAEPVATARAVAAGVTAPGSGAAPATSLTELLRQGVAKGASDIHVHSGTPLRLRLHGRFVAASDAPIEAAEAERMIFSALDEAQAARFREQGELDFSYSVDGLGRFRANVYRQQWGIDGVFRHIPPSPPSLEQLHLPSSLAKFTNFHQGLVLVTGPANCGKSSTLAALVDIINEERREHILTVEDPIEYLHASKRCVVNQRNVGPHTDSFARALRAALREDPDVIVIGELRDLETVSLALTAAETGHLVLGTLHTNSTIRTLNRIVGVFPADQQDQIRNMVSESLRAVVSQRLVPTADGASRVPALEVLVINKAVGNLIRENKTFQINSILQTGASQGMCMLDESLNQLVAAGTVSREEALLHCDDPRKIRG